MRWTFVSKSAPDALAQRPAFIAHLRKWAIPGENFGAAELVFGELVGNVVRHAPGPIDVALDWLDRAPVLSVSDRGPGFAYAGCRLGGSDDVGGRGMFLVGAFSDDVRVEPRPGGGVRVSATLRISRLAAGAR